MSKLMSKPVAMQMSSKAEAERGVPLSPKLAFLFASFILVAVVANAFRIGSSHYAAFGTYWASGYAARTGLNPFASYPLTNKMPIFALGEHHIVADVNLNPPCMLPLFSTMSRLPLVEFGITWTAASLILLLSTVWLLVRRVPTMQTRQVVWLMLSIPVFDTFFGGQIYFLLMFLVAITWIFIDEPGELVSTLSLGLLVAIKPTTAFWPIFLFLAGRRRLALRSLIVTALFTAFPLTLYGGVVYREWGEAIRNDNHWMVPTDIAIPAFFARLGHPRAGLAVAFLFFAGLAWSIWKQRAGVEVASGVALCATLLCAPLAWYDYSLMLAPVFVAHRWNKTETAMAFLLAAPYAFGALLLLPFGSLISPSAGGVPYAAAVSVILICYLRKARSITGHISS